MNLRRLLTLAAAFAAVATAAAVCVVASSYGVYALAKIWLGPAGAAAVVAAVYALVAVAVAVLTTRKAAPKQPVGAPPDEAVVDRLIAIAKDRPILALGAAAAATAAAVTVLVRNPALVTAVVSAFLAGNSSANKPGK